MFDTHLIHFRTKIHFLAKKKSGIQGQKHNLGSLGLLNPTPYEGLKFQKYPFPYQRQNCKGELEIPPITEEEA